MYLESKARKTILEVNKRKHPTCLLYKTCVNY